MRRYVPLLLVAFTLVAYHNSLQGGLVLDDHTTLTGNPSIRHLWPLTGLLHPPVDAGVAGRPVANFTFALGYALGGLDVRIHHAFNLLTHVASVLVLFGLIRRTLERPVLRERFGAVATEIAAVTAALWAVHPLVTNVVDYISQRTEALMALCYLLTLDAFVRAAQHREAGAARSARRWMVIAVVVCAAGMACKEVMVTAPLVVLLYDRTFVSGTWRAARQRHLGVHAALMATWGLLALLMATSALPDRGVGFGQGITPYTYLLTESTALTRYLRLVVWPTPLIFDYGWNFVHHITAALPHLLACAIVIGLTTWALVRRPLLGFVGAAVLIVLAPTTSIYPIALQPIAESRMYLPLTVLVATGVTSLYALAQRRGLELALFVTFASLALTIDRNYAYRSPLDLWTDTLAKVPDSARAWGNRGADFARAGRLTESVADSEAAIRLRPDYADAHNNLGSALARMGRPEEALAHLDVAVRLDPRGLQPLYNRANALAVLGRRREAVEAYRKVLELYPNTVDARNDLSVMLLALDEIAPALEAATLAARQAPDLGPVHYNLANALFASGRIPEAIAEYRAALRIDPRFAKAEHNLAVALLRTGDTRGAIEHFEAALRLQPDYPEARKNLEIVRARSR